MDGELSSQETRHNLLRLKDSAECRETWDTFYLIGDVMRGEPALDDTFTMRVCGRLAEEPTIIAPRFTHRQVIGYTLSAAASLAAVAFVLTLAINVDNPFRPARQQPAQVAFQPPQPINQAKINEYLIAHQEFSPSTMMQGVAPYVRTVSDDQATH